MPPRRLPHQTTDRVWLPLIAAGLVGLAGYFGPWVAHRASGLIVSGLDLGEYVKFIPQVLSDQTAVRREVFYLPLFAGSLMASLLASRRALPRWLRILLGLGAIPLALTLLPPAWSPAVLRLPEFRPQTAALFFCLLMVPAVVVTRYLPDRLVLVLIAALAIPAAVLPAWGFLEVRPAMAGLYRQPLRLGWGFWAELLGFLFVAFWAIAAALTRAAPRSDRHLMG
jgi:hypothetical protein